jgi:hypothetical protein
MLPEYLKADHDGFTYYISIVITLQSLRRGDIVYLAETGILKFAISHIRMQKTGVGLGGRHMSSAGIVYYSIASLISLHRVVHRPYKMERAAWGNRLPAAG